MNLINRKLFTLCAVKFVLVNDLYRDAEKSLSGVTNLVRERFVDELVTTDSNESRHVYCIAPSAGFSEFMFKFFKQRL